MNFMRRYILMFIFLGLIAQGYSQDKKQYLNCQFLKLRHLLFRITVTVQSSRIDISSADKKVWENLAVGLPQMNLAANYLHQFVIPEINLGPYLDVNSLPDGVLNKSDIVNAYKTSPSFPLSVNRQYCNRFYCFPAHFQRTISCWSSGY